MHSNARLGAAVCLVRDCSGEQYGTSLKWEGGTTEGIDATLLQTFVRFDNTCFKFFPHPLHLTRFSRDGKSCYHAISHKLKGQLYLIKKERNNKTNI